jgi:hypothetical protein
MSEGRKKFRIWNLPSSRRVAGTCRLKVLPVKTSLRCGSKSTFPPNTAAPGAKVPPVIVTVLLLAAFVRLDLLACPPVIDPIPVPPLMMTIFFDAVASKTVFVT